MEIADKYRRKLDKIKEMGADVYYREYRPTMSQATEIADYIFSVYVRTKEPYCVCCGKTEPLQCGHLFSRVFTALRWDEMNAATQCAGCNMSHEHHSEPFRRVMVTRHGEEAVSSMWERRLSSKTGKSTAIDRLETALDYYDKYLKLRGK